DLDLMRTVVRKDALAQGRALESDVAAEPELGNADGGVGRVVGREVEERADRGIRLAVVRPVEALEVALQLGVAVRREQAPVVGEVPVERELERIVAVDGSLESGVELAAASHHRGGGT